MKRWYSNSEGIKNKNEFKKLIENKTHPKTQTKPGEKLAWPLPSCEQS